MAMAGVMKHRTGRSVRTGPIYIYISTEERLT